MEGYNTILTLRRSFEAELAMLNLPAEHVAAIRTQVFASGAMKAMPPGWDHQRLQRSILAYARQAASRSATGSNAARITREIYDTPYRYQLWDTTRV